MGSSVLSPVQAEGPWIYFLQGGAGGKKHKIDRHLRLHPKQLESQKSY